MRSRTIALAAAGLLAAMLAGCVGLEESRTTGDNNERRILVDVPNGATQLRVDVDATARAGEPDVTILVEDDAGANLATDTFSVSGSTTRSVTVDVAGPRHVTVVARVVDGDASLDVRVVAIVPGQPELIVVREQVVIAVTATTTPASTTPTPASTTAPAPTPVTTTAPPVTNNSTNNSTG
jgi:hypothetical protein